MYDKYRDYFNKIYKSSKVRFPSFPHHVAVVTKWAEKLCDQYPEADKDVTIIAALLHDLGHFSGKDDDHAISSEKVAKKFLEKQKLPIDKLARILHAIRAHRNKDIRPDSIEAKIVCCADSASHMSSNVYLNVLPFFGKNNTLAKLERDYRDLSDFPQIKQQLTPLYWAWKNLLTSFPDDFIDYLPK